MQWVAQSWLIFRLTGSPLLLGLLGFAGNIPIFLLAPLGGAVTDRFCRRHILLVTQSLAMICSLLMALLTLLDYLQVWQIFAFALITGTINAFDIPTHQAFLADVVDKKDLMNAISLNSSLINFTRIIGPAAAGFLIAEWGEGWCFFINSASFIPAVIGILLMTEIPENKSNRQHSTLFNMIEGFRIVSGHSVIRHLLLLTALLGLIGMSFTVLLPILSGEVLQAGPNGLGQLVGAAGSGALLAALSFAGYRNSKGLGRWIIISSIIFGFSLIFLSLSDSFRISAALLFILGFSQVVQLDSANKLLQSIVSNHIRGRVMAFYILVLMGLTPFGTLAAGGLAAYIGVLPTMAICGVVYLVFAVIVVIRLLHHIRAQQAGRLYSASQPEPLDNA